MRNVLLKAFWLAAVMFCFVALINSCKEDKPDTPEEPEVGRPEPPYTVVEADFQTTRGSLKIGGKLYLPKELEKYSKSAAIFCTGLDASWKDTEVYARAAAKQGIVSCCFDFCGGPSGASLSEGNKSDNTILTEVQDLTAVYAAIKAREDIDSGRIFLMGGSQGGLVAALYAADHPADVLALGLMFPAFNLPEIVRQYAGLLGGVENLPESVTVQGHTIYKKYAVDAYGIYPFDVIGKYEGPVLIMHGTQDTTVPIANSQQAVKVYKNAELVVLDGQGHGFDATGTQKAIENLERFFLR